MNQLLNTLLIVVGFCTATVGAAGFKKGEFEGLAIPLFAGGMALVVIGGLMQKKAKRAGLEAKEGEEGGALAEYKALLDRIHSIVIELDDRKEQLGGDAVTRRIDELFRAEYFDLTSKNEELQSLVGYTAYAKVWDGIAIGERLLSRCWSLCTDEHEEEGLRELPAARAQLERAVAAMATL